MKAKALRLGLFSSVLALFAAATAQAAGPFNFYSVTPCRIVDTRGAVGVTGGPALSSSVARNFPIAGQCGVPSTAKAVTLNVTFVGPTRAGYLTIWPYSTTQPLVSTINAAAGEAAIANGAIVPLTTDPTFNISVFYGVGGVAGTTNIILDVTGYFQ